MNSDLLSILGLFVGVVLVIGGGTGLFVNWVEQTSCLNSYENFQPQYGFFSGCRIVVNGILTPTDIVRELK